MCEGYGLVRTTESAALVALRKIHNRVAQGDIAALRASLPPDVAAYLLNQKRDDLAQLERRYATRIHVALNEKLMPHQSELETQPRVEGGQPIAPQIRLGGVAGAEAAAQEPPGNNGAPAIPTVAEVTPAGPAAGEGAAGGKRRRRRRGRRRGRGRQAAAAIGEAFAAIAAGTSLVPGRELSAREARVSDEVVSVIPEVEQASVVPESAELFPAANHTVESEPAAAETQTPVAPQGAAKPRTRRARAATRPRQAPKRRTARKATPQARAVENTQARGDAQPPQRRKTTRQQPRTSRPRRSRAKTAPAEPEPKA